MMHGFELMHTQLLLRFVSIETLPQGYTGNYDRTTSYSLNETHTSAQHI